MPQSPTTTWINTFRFAASLKIVGVFVAMLTARINSDTWAWERWWGALATGLLLLLILLPWHKRFSSPKAIHWQMIGALIFAIGSHQLDMLQSSYAPYDLLLANERFQILIGWSLIDVNNVHSLGALFVMVPVILAGWQYGPWGMWLSMGVAGLLYIIAPVWLPLASFNWWFYAVRGFVMMGVTLILAAIVTTLAQEQRARQAELAVANAKLSEQAQVMAQLATSRERNRLARELHDTLAHSLSGTAVQLEAVQILLAHDHVAATAELKEARQQIRLGLKEARRAITALRASPVEQLGLNEALRQQAIDLAEQSGMMVHLELSGIWPLSPAEEQTVFRVASEALKNISKHSKGINIWLTLTQSGDNLQLLVKDDGQGFVPESVDQTIHFGLMGMRERAELIGGTLAVESNVEAGTTVSLTIPRQT